MLDYDTHFYGKNGNSTAGNYIIIIYKNKSYIVKGGYWIIIY